VLDFIPSEYIEPLNLFTVRYPLETKLVFTSLMINIKYITVQKTWRQIYDNIRFTSVHKIYSCLKKYPNNSNRYVYRLIENAQIRYRLTFYKYRYFWETKRMIFEYCTWFYFVNFVRTTWTVYMNNRCTRPIFS